MILQDATLTQLVLIQNQQPEPAALAQENAMMVHATYGLLQQQYSCQAQWGPSAGISPMSMLQSPATILELMCRVALSQATVQTVESHGIPILRH